MEDLRITLKRVKAIESQTRLKLVVDRFDMVVKNEECLSCHIIIIGKLHILQR